MTPVSMAPAIAAYATIWPVLSELLDAVLDSNIEHCCVWLGQLQARDSGLARELGLLLACHSFIKTERFLEEAPCDARAVAPVADNQSEQT